MRNAFATCEHKRSFDNTSFARCMNCGGRLEVINGSATWVADPDYAARYSAPGGPSCPRCGDYEHAGACAPLAPSPATTTHACAQCGDVHLPPSAEPEVRSNHPDNWERKADNWERKDLFWSKDPRMNTTGRILERLRENQGALQAAAALIESEVTPLPCDHKGSASCIRCTTVYLARIGNELAAAFGVIEAVDEALESRKSR